ncbi:periostin-like isoform X2 [Dreissena polymorpha]|nr:periostin-like isoform X2 [Dreissena polymorpha]XP_052228210.1 periostin-like isoform X2 [Dreissena polymorpha]
MDGQEGCPAIKPTKNIRDTLVDLGLKEFLRLLKNTELEYRMLEAGAYTVFAPIDEAFEHLTQDQRTRVFPWTYNALSLLHYHVVPGWHHSDLMGRHDMLPTLYYGLKPVMINKSAKQGLHTVNCALMIRNNILASNGVIHLVDQMLQTFDMFGNLTDVMFRDSAQYSQFIQVLYTSELFPLLRAEGPFTLFAPSNYAFSRLPKHTLERVLREQRSAEAVVRHHTAAGVHCISAVMDKAAVRMLDGTKATLQCKKSGHYLQNSKIVTWDTLAGNGVVHIINKIQLPSFIQSIDGVARELGLNKFLQLCFDAGLLDKLQADTEMTLFAPSDEAFNDLHKNKKKEVFSDPEVFESIFDYALTVGKVHTDNFMSDSGIVMNNGLLLKLAIHREGILVDDASITSPNHVAANGFVHIVDKVLFPPKYDIYTVIKQNPQLSIFRKGLEITEVRELLSDAKATYSVFVPTDAAFEKLPTWQVDALFDDEKKMRMLLKHHIVGRYVIHRAIPLSSVLLLESLQGEHINFHHTAEDKYSVDTYSDLLDSPIIASNGIIYLVDRVLECACKQEPS